MMQKTIDTIEEVFHPDEHAPTDDGWCSVVNVGNESVEVTVEMVPQVTVSGYSDASILLRKQLKSTFAGSGVRVQ